VVRHMKVKALRARPGSWRTHRKPEKDLLEIWRPWQGHHMISQPEMPQF
jgi:hypothetical protein